MSPAQAERPLVGRHLSITLQHVMALLGARATGQGERRTEAMLEGRLDRARGRYQARGRGLAPGARPRNAAPGPGCSRGNLDQSGQDQRVSLAMLRLILPRPFGFARSSM